MVDNTNPTNGKPDDDEYNVVRPAISTNASAITNSNLVYYGANEHSYTTFVDKDSAQDHWTTIISSAPHYAVEILEEYPKYHYVSRRLQGLPPSPEDFVLSQDVYSSIPFLFTEHALLMTRATVEETVSMLEYALSNMIVVDEFLIKISPHYNHASIQNVLVMLMSVDLLKKENRYLENMFNALRY